MREASERRVGALKVLALALALINDGIHGYELCRRISELSGGKWVPSIGTIYRILNELAKEGYLSRSEEGRGERQVIIYRLTEEGMNFLVSKLPCILRKNYLGMKIVLEAYVKLVKRGLIKLGGDDIAMLNELRGLINELKNLFKD